MNAMHQRAAKQPAQLLFGINLCFVPLLPPLLACLQLKLDTINLSKNLVRRIQNLGHLTQLRVSGRGVPLGGLRA